MNNTAQKPIEGEIMGHEIAAYNPFRAQLAELQAANAKTVFQYDTPTGYAAAKSYVFQLSKTAAALEKLRVEIKAPALQTCKAIDSEAKEIEAAIRAMQEVHKAPLLEIDEREKARVAAIRFRIDNDIVLAGESCAGIPSERIKATLEDVRGIAIDVSFAEFQAEAQKAKDAAIEALLAELPIAEKREADAAELKRLQDAEAARIQKERDDKIAADAAAKATADAEAKAKAEKDEADRIAQAERDAAAKKLADAEAEKLAAQQRADKAVEDERVRVQKEKDAQDAADAKREADKKHQAGIHAEIIKALEPLGITDELAKAIITAIRKGEVPHVKINY